jgi:hypothetical protein
MSSLFSRPRMGLVFVVLWSRVEAIFSPLLLGPSSSVWTGCDNFETQQVRMITLLRMINVPKVEKYFLCPYPGPSANGVRICLLVLYYCWFQSYSIISTENTLWRWTVHIHQYAHISPLFPHHVCQVTPHHRFYIIPLQLNFLSKTFRHAFSTWYNNPKQFVLVCKSSNTAGDKMKQSMHKLCPTFSIPAKFTLICTSSCN